MYRYVNYKCTVYVVCNVQFPNAMYKCVSYDGQCIVMIFLIVRADFIASLNIAQHTNIIVFNTSCANLGLKHLTWESPLLQQQTMR